MCRRITLIIVVLFCLLLFSCKQTISPLDLHFKKDYQVRNFYNTSVTLSSLELSKGALVDSVFPRSHLTAPGCVFSSNENEIVLSNNSESLQESYITIGELYNYAAIDLDIQRQCPSGNTANVMLTYVMDEDNRIVITQKAGTSESVSISLAIYKNGILVINTLLAESGVVAPNTLRVHLAGKYINVLLVKNEDWTVLGSFDICEYFELRDKSILKQFSVKVGGQLGSGAHVAIKKVEQYLTCGTAQADPKVLHYEDGAPIIEGNTIWVAMTTRAYDTQLYQGIYSYNLISKEWKLTGTVVFNKGDGLIRQWSASDVFYDRLDEKWKIFTVSHRDDHMLYSGESVEDPRYGLTEINCSKVKYSSVGNEEDPSVLYDEEVGKWRMAICKANDGYETVLLEADEWDSEWKEISLYKPTSSTGVLIQKIGGERYVFIGRGDTPCPLEVLSYPEMKKLGELKLSEHPIGKNIWPAIIPISRSSGTSYYLLTFDRDAWTGQRTYGNIHWYEAEEVAVGYQEYQ